MLQDIAPHQYHIEFAAPEPQPGDTVLFFHGQEALLSETPAGLAFPSRQQLPAGWPQPRYLFAIDHQRFFLHLGEDSPELPGFAFRRMDDFRGALPPELTFAGITGAQLWRWYRSHRYCGCCGQPTRHSDTERALICDACRLTNYPRISPAAIIAVTDGDKLLLTRYADRPYRRWSLVAGFCEVGETMESTIRREVMEEVGLSVTNIRYYKSQPWSFSDSLLLGFYCDVTGSREQHADGTELSEAQWFTREELPPDERGPISLTQEMIEQFRAGQEPR